MGYVSPPLDVLGIEAQLLGQTVEELSGVLCVGPVAFWLGVCVIDETGS